MTPQERDLVTQLFDRLAGLERAPRDPDAERLIIDGLRRAPNATYALVQTALVQDEALKRADARIRELENGNAESEPGQPAGFLDNMREALLGGRREAPRAGSVPSVRPSQPGAGPSAGAPWPQGAAWPPQQAPVGGSFLGTAASAAAGVIGGSLLLDGIRSMMGHGHGAFAAADPGYTASRNLNSPWDGAGNDDLSRQAGIDHIGTASRDDSGQGVFDPNDDTADPQPDQNFDGFDDDGADSGSDFGGDDFGGSDAA